MANRIINAIHEDELEEYLENIGILDDIKNKKLKCCFCDKTITLENFHVVFPENNEIKICCEDMQCRLKIKE